MSTIENRVKVLQQLKPFVSDEETYDRVHCDLHDLIEASQWLLSEVDKRE